MENGNDRTGNFNRFTANLSYAYHLALNAKTNLSAGFAAGISSVGLNADGDGYAAMVGVNVANTFNVSYAYDFTQTDLKTVSKGTHEFIIGFLIGNRYGDTCPRNVWQE